MPGISKAINHIARKASNTIGYKPDHDVHCEGCGALLKTRHCCYCGRTYSAKWWCEQTGEVEQVLRHYSYHSGVKVMDGEVYVDRDARLIITDTGYEAF